MDFIYHGLVGYAIAQETGSKYVIPSIVSAMLPDLVGIIPFYYFKLFEAKKRTDGPFLLRWYYSCMNNTFVNNIDAGWYRSTHSLFMVAIIGLVTHYTAPSASIPVTLSYLSHILIDIPTHDGDFATQFFYPLSSVQLPGANWAKHPKRFFFFWGILGLYFLVAKFF